jgi:hypothetical protein
MMWKEQVSELAGRIQATEFAKENVAAISAGLDDVSDGLARVVQFLNAALDERDDGPVLDAQLEVDQHLRPHLRDMSKALTRLRKHLRDRGGSA